MFNLWAVAYDDVAHAERLCRELLKLDAEGALQVQELLIVLRRPDGTFELRREAYPPAGAMASGGALGFLVGALLIQPLVGPGVGALAAMLGPAVGAFFGNIVGVLLETGIDTQFVKEVQSTIKPGSVLVFALGVALAEDKVLPRLQGLTGKVLRTNVDVDRASRIQELLNTQATERLDQVRPHKPAH